jgi:pilus assembly protein FimV
MLKRLALALAVLAWWVPAQVFALGLGNIDMKSALNQPLDARIELLRAREGELKDLTVALASPDTFRRAGIERPAFLSQLKFEVITNPGGTPFIQVSSPQPITEPFLNFLIEVNWPNGRLLREFTVLVDPPVLTDTPPVAVTAPAAQAGVDPVGIVVDQVAAERMRAEAEGRDASAAPVEAPAAEPVVAEAPAAPAVGIEIPPPSRARIEAEREAAPVTRPSAPEPEAADPAAEAVAALDATEAPEAPAESVRPKPTRREAPVRSPEPEPVAEAVPEPGDVRDGNRAEPEVAAGDFNHKVRANETLWEIAMNSRPRNVSVPQMMIALLENNPEAFVDNNINNLKRGAVLRLQDVGVAMNISKDEAMRIADLQWEQWKQQRGSMVGSTMARRGAPPADVAPSEARVKLVSPDSDTTGSEAPGAAQSGGTSAAARVRRELAVAQEALDSQRRETQDMRDRVASLEEQLSTMKRLIQMKDDQLAAMQTQSKTSTLAPEAAAPAAAATAEQKPAETKAAAKPAAKPKADEPAKPTGLLAGLMNDPKLIGLAGVVVGLIVLLTWLFVRRRKMQQFQESILTLDEAASSSISSDMKAESEDASFMSDFTVSSMEGIQSDVNEVDPLSEADVYLAYGRHKQAEDLVTQAIQKDPNRPELKMKLMEIHYAAKDKDAFALQAETIRDEFSAQQPEMWARVLEMGRELAPDNALFGGSGAAAPAKAGAAEEFDLGDLNMGDATAPTGADDLSLDFDLSGDETTTTAKSAAAKDDNSLDFDLGDFKMDSDAGEPAAAETATAADSEHSLDFDLSAFDENKEPAQAGAASDDNSLDFDLGALGETVQDAADEVSLDTASAELDQGNDSGLDFKLDDEPIAAPAKSKRDDNVVDFNLAASSAKNDVDTAVEDREIDGELDDALFADVDEVGTKLDLAKAYIDMGDSEGARSILDEVMEEGDDSQKKEAQVLMRQIG